MAIEVGINGFGRVGRNVPRPAVVDNKFTPSGHSGGELVQRMERNPDDRIFLLIFFAVLGLVVASLSINFVFAVSTKNQKLITNLSEATLWVYKDGFLLIIGLLAHLLLRRLSK